MSRVPTSADDLRQRVAGWRAAERREREVRRDEPVLGAAKALEAALELCELDPSEPGFVDAVREREVLGARAAWAKLRKRLGWQPSAARRI